MNALIAPLRRIRALMRKETLQILRDRATLGMLLGIPLLQIVVFGFAIELTPRNLDIALLASAADGPRLERLVQQIAGPARIQAADSMDAARRRVARGETELIIDALHRPVSIYIDASNPIVALYAEQHIERFVRIMEAPIESDDATHVAVHVERLYNPHSSTQPFLLTGLLGAIPTMSLVMMAALTVARERERRTLDVLRASPARFLEVVCGKLLPYLLLGLVQSALIFMVIGVVFGIGMDGSGVYLGLALTLFAAANLTLGFLFSCLARQQLQAAQLTFFYFLPSSLLSGFMFPFSAMPAWARAIGEVLPMTHYLRITRGVMLRGVDAAFICQETLPIILFTALSGLAAYWGWRKRCA